MARSSTRRPKRRKPTRRRRKSPPGYQPEPQSESQPESERPVKVAIVGGGCAGIAAAWELSKYPKYDVSVFESSWRLGGKGASGRDAGGRIKEHGLHLWLGFYENAFKMVRDCYDEVKNMEWGSDGPRLAHASFAEAFIPEPHVGVTGASAGGGTAVWSGYLHPEKGLPGDPIDAETNPFTVASYLIRSVNLLKALMVSVIGRPAEELPGTARADRRSTVDENVDLNFSLDPARSPELLIQRIAGAVRDGTLTLAAALLQAVTIFENILQDLNHSPQVAGSALNLMKALAGQARKQLREFVAIDPKLRWKTEIIDIVMTIVVGLYRDRVLFQENGFDAINDLDYREWLTKHGATDSAVKSPFITGIYDFVFAYEGGDRSRPRLAAGVALRGALRMFFTYRGSMFWRLGSGMGDAVFAPLYKVLTKATAKRPRPVKFHFLHSLQKVDVDWTKPERFVTSLTFMTTGDESAAGTNPLDEFGCWPDSDRLLVKSRGKKRAGARPVIKNVDDDFDAVIFATGLEDFASLVRNSAGHAEALGTVGSGPLAAGQTVATKAAQVWLAKDLEELGWYRGSGIISALGSSFDTWADMTHTLASERDWRVRRGLTGPKAKEPRSVAYFCGVLSEEVVKAGKASLKENLEADLKSLLSRSIQPLWPGAFADGKTAEKLSLGKHLQANTSGSDRYSLSLPGSIRNRLSPLDCPVLNMTVAGDWTACGLDAGCVEAAVMSGMLAAHAIDGTNPTLESIIGYDHP